MRRESQRGRLIVAVVVVAGVMASVPVTNAIAQSVQFASLFSGVMDASGESDLAKRVSGDSVESTVSEVFADEAFSVEREREVCFLPEQELVGFCRDEGAASSFSSIKGVLEAKGWTHTESGLETCGTFCKETGELCWLFVSCTEIEGQTSVVVQYASIGAKD